MIKKIAIYGLVLALLTLGLKLAEYKLVIMDRSLELYGGLLAVLFTTLGIYTGNRLTRKKEVIIEKTVLVPQQVTIIKEVPVTMPAHEVNGRLVEKLGISPREYEILEFMAQGYSNQEIADKAFVSVSTVKTHVSNLFVKLDVQRRTQAIKKAKELHLIP